MILLDTNVLVYAIQAKAPQHDASRRLVEAVQAGRCPACLFPQILLEFFAVMTDAGRLETPATKAEGLDLVKMYSAILPVLQPSHSALDIFLALAEGSGVHGQRVFDCYLVAQAMDAGVGTICTYNIRDFAGYPVAARTPEEILGATVDSGPPVVHERLPSRIRGRGST